VGRQHAKIISKTAFEKAFVEGEVIMRRNLAALIEKEIQDIIFSCNDGSGEADGHYVRGLRKAQEIVFGKVERDES